MQYTDPGQSLPQNQVAIAIDTAARQSTTAQACLLGPVATQLQQLTDPNQRGGKTHSDSLANLLQAHRIRDTLDVHLVPVSIFIGRIPDRQSGWFAVLFSENWALVGRFRRLLAVLLNGRNTIVCFAPPSQYVKH